MTLTKDKLIDRLQNEAQLSAADARNSLELLLDSIKSCLENGVEMKVSGFGKWEVLTKRERTGRNPYTGEPMKIAPRRVVAFHPADKLRNSVNTNVSTD